MIAPQGERWVVELRHQGQLIASSAVSLCLSGSAEEPGDVLRPGDKIAIKGNDALLELVLLSPCVVPWNSHRLGFAEAEGWRNFLNLVRGFFQDGGFLEIATPSLVVCPGTEPSLDPLAVSLRTGSRTEQRYLPTSPELHLKKFLAQGWNRIFEIRSCFRDGEHSNHHQIEFTMMEFYRAFEGLEAIEKDLESLLERMNRAGLVLGGLQSCRRYTVADLFKNSFDFELRADTTAAELGSLCARTAIASHHSDSWNDLFHRLWLERIEPWLGAQDFPIFVGSFPPTQAALARIGADGWAERVELFWRGMEIANGFHELNDPAEQQRRFMHDLDEKQKLGKVKIPLDEDFMNALLSGMPPASGIAVGLERLFMAARKIERIQSLKAFPYGN